MIAPMDYIRDPKEIYRRSFETVVAETDVAGIPTDAVPLVHRLVHACGMPDITSDLRVSKTAISAGRRALSRDCPIFADCTMVSSGIISDRLANNNHIICTLDGTAIARGTTRSATAVEAWLPNLENAVVAIGNAPTALFRLLEILQAGGPKPAIIMGFPVGFVGAAESKAALVSNSHDVPFITLLGRRGGSAIAAAAVNALASDTIS